MAIYGEELEYLTDPPPLSIDVSSISQTLIIDDESIPTSIAETLKDENGIAVHRTTNSTIIKTRSTDIEVLSLEDRRAVHEAFVGMVLINQFIKEDRQRGEDPIFITTLAFRRPNPVVNASLTSILYLELVPSSYLTMRDWFFTRQTWFGPAALTPASLTAIIKRIFTKFNQYYQRCGFTHYDLHPKNIMIEPATFSLKIIDYECVYFRSIAGRNYGIDGRYPQYYDRGNWIHDVFKLLVNISRTLDEIINGPGKKNLFSLLKTGNSSVLKLLEHYGIQPPRWQDFITTSFPSADDDVFWTNYDNTEPSLDPGLLTGSDLENFETTKEEKIHSIIRLMSLQQDPSTSSTLSPIIKVRERVNTIISDFLKFINCCIDPLSLEQWLDKVYYSNRYTEANWDTSLTQPEVFQRWVTLFSEEQ